MRGLQVRHGLRVEALGLPSARRAPGQRQLQAAEAELLHHELIILPQVLHAATAFGLEHEPTVQRQGVARFLAQAQGLSQLAADLKPIARETRHMSRHQEHQEKQARI